MFNISNQKDTIHYGITQQDIIAIAHYKNKQSLQKLGIDPNHCYLYQPLYIPDFEIQGQHAKYKISELIDIVSDLSKDSIFPEDVVFGFSNSYSIPHAYDESFKFGFDFSSLQRYISKLSKIKSHKGNEDYISLLKNILVEMSYQFERLQITHIIIRDEL